MAAPAAQPFFQTSLRAHMRPHSLRSSAPPRLYGVRGAGVFSRVVYIDTPKKQDYYILGNTAVNGALTLST